MAGVASPQEKTAVATPDLVGLHSRVHTLDPLEDVSEYLFAKGFSDGFPLVAPTVERVRFMLSATTLAAETTLGTVAPNGGRLTCEKAAINAVMAGCAPKHFPVVLAAVECILDEKFNLHGISATTMGATPVLLVSGPSRHDADLNFKTGAMGAGHRANACIGRAIKLIMQNVGGGKLGGTESTTLGTPMKYTMCTAEWEERAAEWEPYHVTKGFQKEDSVVTVMAGMSGPHQLVDFKFTDPEVLIAEMAKVLYPAYNTQTPMINDVICVISPEHYDTLLRGGITSKKILAQKLWEYTNYEMIATMHKVVQMAKPGLLGAVAGYTVGLLSQLGALVGLTQSVMPKFDSPESFHILVAGGPAGKFSMFIPGFSAARPPHPFARLSVPVHRQIRTPPASMKTGAPVCATPHVLLDPTGETAVTRLQLTKRTGSLSGTIGLMDISKGGGAVFFNRMSQLIKREFPALTIKRFVKETFARVASPAVREAITSTCDYLILALAD